MYNDPYKRIEDLLSYIEVLEAELNNERAKSNQYLNNWIAAQDLAAGHNVQLCSGMKPEENK